MANIKEGVNWDDMHLLAEKIIIKHLRVFSKLNKRIFKIFYNLLKYIQNLNFI